jgi:cysteine desulfurase
MIYFDYNATTPIDPAVRGAMTPFLDQEFGNPSSFYALGRTAATAVTKAREQVAHLINATSSEITFTSCATESIATAFLSALEAAPEKQHLITSTVEHSATLELCRHYESRGYEVTYLPVDRDGNLSLEQLKESITPSTALISLLWANNETGVIFPIDQIAAIAAERKAALHLDAVQAVGKIPIDLQALPISYLSLSGHKIYAPKGIGALYVHRHASYTPLLRGSQEGTRRGGTENVASIVGFGYAAMMAREKLFLELPRLTALRDRFEKTLLEKLQGVHRNGSKAPRLPNTSSVTFNGIDAASALFLFDDKKFCCSAGSACNTQSRSPSHVLSAMGNSLEEARATLRFSIGRFTTEAEVDQALEIVSSVVEKLRKLS